MPTPSMLMLYVDNPTASAAFYADLLGASPVEASPTFALFVLPNGLKLGLWSRHTLAPTATPPGGSELCLEVADEAAVEARHAAWREAGLPIAQAPTRMDFGYTCVALDPDGHRLRAYVLAQD
jgi:catechol 2,3-dioxygenase-like lactoylglutathione lyase family enzyme